MHVPLWIKRMTTRIPQVTDYVWWAPKQLEGVVTHVFSTGFRFEAGPIVEHKTGKKMPEWTVTANWDAGYWDESLHCWIVGQGAVPKNIQGVTILPLPVSMRMG